MAQSQKSLNLNSTHYSHLHLKNGHETHGCVGTNTEKVMLWSPALPYLLYLLKLYTHH